MDYRIGIGYDTHKLVEDRLLVLGGVTIPFEKGLLGHSDADVLVHAIIDSLLGAAKLGDIGRLFPDNRIEFKGISSILLLERVGKLLQENNYAVVNIDSIIIAQRPKLVSYINEMEENIARALCIESSKVSVKATTEEGLGFTGALLGINAKSICLITNQ